jgi:hypothetical protein
MFWQKQKKKLVEVAETLFVELVQKPVIFMPADFRVSENSAQQFENKLYTYQFTIVLMALLREEQNNLRFALVREYFEKIFFPEDQNERLKILANVKSAMADLESLFFGEMQEKIGWAAAWFQDIGINEDNPVVLARFVFSWTNHYAGVVESLQEIGKSIL